MNTCDINSEIVYLKKMIQSEKAFMDLQPDFSVLTKFERIDIDDCQSHLANNFVRIYKIARQYRLNEIVVLCFSNYYLLTLRKKLQNLKTELEAISLLKNLHLIALICLRMSMKMNDTQEKFYQQTISIDNEIKTSAYQHLVNLINIE